MAAAPGSPRTGDESSESENETEPAKIFHRKLSTKKDVKSAVGRFAQGKREGYCSGVGTVCACKWNNVTPGDAPFRFRLAERNGSLQ
ncbi:hypothetical protein ZHAS_00011744 [Anopheles sinensis]|uniref:Uncharacterized protein n=1 Tax=Anopheles sinensis TaxID=74873 RepID=A0A084W100_ANOSI|nr:hypothetical protein ZHAS_00011744 [Anopheles sinensis]